MLLSEALDGVSKLVAAFPNGGQAAGKSYIGALASVLVDYPKSIAARCVDPRTGVARETRFLPTVADLVAFCERETDSMRKPVDSEDREARILREMAERKAKAEKLEEARAKRPTYDELKAKYGPNWGIGNSDDNHKRETPQQARDKLIAMVGQEAFDAIPNADEYAMQRLKYPGRRYGEEPVP